MKTIKEIIIQMLLVIGFIFCNIFLMLLFDTIGPLVFTGICILSYCYKNEISIFEIIEALVKKDEKGEAVDMPTGFTEHWEDYNHFNPFAGRYKYNASQKELTIGEGFLVSNIGSIIITDIYDKETHQEFIQKLFGICDVHIVGHRGKYTLKNIRKKKARILFDIINIEKNEHDSRGKY